MKTQTAKQRLEYIRAELRAERISYSEIAELQSLASHIEPGDVELMEAASVPENKAEQTSVIFRTFISGGDVIALFPLEPWDRFGHSCTSYQHIGQHGGASIDLCKVSTKPSTPDEIEPLKRELESLGYSLRVLKRIPSKATEIRREKAGNPIPGVYPGHKFGCECDNCNPC